MVYKSVDLWHPMNSGFIKLFSQFLFPYRAHGQQGYQEGQCLSGTADLAESVLDCLSTGMKITVVFVFVVVFFSTISAMAASSAIPAGSAFAAASAAQVDSGRLEVPEH